MRDGKRRHSRKNRRRALLVNVRYKQTFKMSQASQTAIVLRFKGLGYTYVLSRHCQKFDWKDFLESKNQIGTQS